MEQEQTGGIIPADRVRIFICSLETRNIKEYEKNKPDGYPKPKEFKDLYGLTFSNMAFRRGKAIARFKFKR
jgi:antitoxin component HigA of HigAB toxin-antitoxin module